MISETKDKEAKQEALLWDLFSSITRVIYWSKPEGFVLFLNQMHAFRTQIIF